MCALTQTDLLPQSLNLNHAQAAFPMSLLAYSEEDQGYGCDKDTRCEMNNARGVKKGKWVMYRMRQEKVLAFAVSQTA